MRLFITVCIGCAVLLLGGCSLSAKKPSATAEPNSQVTYVEGADFVGVVRAVDKEAGKVTLYNTSFEGTADYSYSGATAIYSKNDRDMVMDEVSVGDAFEVYTNDEGSKIQKMKEAADVIVSENTEVSVDAEQKRLTVQGVTYAYTENMVVYSNGSYLDPMEITSDDRVTFCGVRGQAYSLVVTRGHGYIRPEKYRDFVGGKLIVQGEAILPVSEDMLVTVPEGTQKITMANEDFTGTASVLVKRGQVTSVDMSQFIEQSPNTARVKFNIEPEGAQLYVNGSLVDYSKSVKLHYGTHSIQVVLEGYNDYSGILNIKEPNPTVSINLSQETAEIEADSDDSDSSSDDGSSDDDSSGTVTKKASTAQADFDTDHQITVSAPKGAAVYIDGTYKGEAPCSFTKMLGSVTLTLTKSGYKTKSYQVTISDDSQDITWSFPELEKKEEGEG